jgi:hypothetical protein
VAPVNTAAAPSSTEPTATPTEEPQASSEAAGDVIRQAALAAEEIESVRGTMTMSVDAAGERLDIDAVIAMSGTRAHMTMRMLGEEIEMLFDLPNLYMNVPGQGWFKADPAALGVDLSQFEQLIEDEGLVNLNALADLKNQDFEELSGEDINGDPHRRFRANLTLDELMALNPDSAELIPPESQELLDQADGSVLIDVWVSEATGIATRTAMDMTFDLLGMEMTMTMRFDITEVNGDVEKPDPPGDARDLSELGGF